MGYSFDSTRQRVEGDTVEVKTSKDEHAGALAALQEEKRRELVAHQLDKEKLIQQHTLTVTELQTAMEQVAGELKKQVRGAASCGAYGLVGACK